MANAIRFEVWKSADFSTITSSYTALGTPFDHTSRMVQFINGTNADIAISFNGTDNNVPVIAGTAYTYDITTNQDQIDSCRISMNTQCYVKYIAGAPTSGTFYAVSTYARGE